MEKSTQPVARKLRTKNNDYSMCLKTNYIRGGNKGHSWDTGQSGVTTRVLLNCLVTLTAILVTGP